MGTRGSVGVIYNDEIKLAYNHFDSYPDGLGADTLEIIAKINEENGWEIFKKHAAQLKAVDDEITDPKMIEKYKKFADLNVSEQKFSDPYCLFREIQGADWIDEMYKGELQDYLIDNKFITESLFCEYAYIINLDSMKFEFYDGFQKKQQKGNRFGEELCEGYYPCRLVGLFNLEGIDSDSVTTLVERMTDILNSGKDDHSVTNYFRKPKMDAINEKSLE